MRTGTRTAARAHTLTQMHAALVELLAAGAFARECASAATRAPRQPRARVHAHAHMRCELSFTCAGPRAPQHARTCPRKCMRRRLSFSPPAPSLANTRIRRDLSSSPVARASARARAHVLYLELHMHRSSRTAARAHTLTQMHTAPVELLATGARPHLTFRTSASASACIASRAPRHSLARPCTRVPS